MFFSGGVVPGGLVISNKLLYLSDIRISWYVLCRDSGGKFRVMRFGGDGNEQ